MNKYLERKKELIRKEKERLAAVSAENISLENVTEEKPKTRGCGCKRKRQANSKRK